MSWRLGKGFGHAFILDTDLLIAPQNIKLEIWSLTERKVVQRVHPQMFCMRGAPDFSADGCLLVMRGGCTCGESQIKIYKADGLTEVAGFEVQEELQIAPVFNG